MGKGKVLVIGSNATRIEVQGGGWGPDRQLSQRDRCSDDGHHRRRLRGRVGDARTGPSRRSTKPRTHPWHLRRRPSRHARAKAFWANDAAVNQVRTLGSVIDEGLDKYAGVFVPGGQAPVVDLMQDREMGEILRHFHDRAKPTALLCHGPIASVAAMPHAREFRAALIAGECGEGEGMGQGLAIRRAIR